MVSSICSIRSGGEREWWLNAPSNQNYAGRCGTSLLPALEEFQPDILAAHSLGTLITYDLFRNDRRGRDILANGVYITFGSQINNLFARSRLFPGQIQVPNVRFWYHLFNPQDLEFIKKTRKFTGNYNTLKSIARFRAMEARKLLVDALARLQLLKNYRVKAQMSAGEKSTDIVADRNGENYEIHMPELWLKSVGNEHWVSRDEGQSWKPTQPDTYLLESPLTAQFQGPLGTSRPRVEEVDRKELGDETMVHLRVVPSGLDSSYASIVPEYWITRTATDAVLQKFAGPTLFFKTVVFLRAEYTQWGQIREISKPEVANSQRKQE